MRQGTGNRRAEAHKASEETVELSPELDKYLDRKADCLEHPLVLDPFYQVANNKKLNVELREKERALERAMAISDWEQAFELITKPWKIRKLLELSSRMSDREYWEIAITAWHSSSNSWKYPDLVRELFYPADREPCSRKYMMNTSERQVLSSLRKSVSIYRGCGCANRDWWSWTRSLATAKGFSRRSFATFGEQYGGLVRVGSCHKDHILTYCDRRREQEIIIDPCHVDVYGEEICRE